MNSYIALFVRQVRIVVVFIIDVFIVEIVIGYILVVTSGSLG